NCRTASTAVRPMAASRRSAPGGCFGFVKVPADDPESVLDGGVEPGAVEPPVGSFGDGDKPAGHRVGRGHDRQQPFDLVGIAHDLRPGEDVLAAQPDPLGPAVGQVELPVPPAGGQQHRAVANVTDRLPVGLAGLAPGEEYQHEPAAQRGGKRQSQHGAHRHVQRPEHALLDAPAEGAPGWCGHWSLLPSGRTARNDGPAACGSLGGAYDSTYRCLNIRWRIFNPGRGRRGGVGCPGRSVVMASPSKGDTMSYARQLLDTYPGTINADAGVLAAAIDALSDCAQACIADTEADLSEQNLAEMVKCIRLCLDCTDVCTATMGIVSRQAEYDANVT